MYHLQSLAAAAAQAQWRPKRNGTKSAAARLACGERAMSATILPFLRDTSFDSDVTGMMGKAYDQALRALHDKGQPHIVQEVIARKIIELAEAGERDADRMCQRALASLGIAQGG
jgi:hypothetical protein